MPRFAVKFSCITGVSTVHAENCRAAISRSTSVTAFLEADSAQLAAARADEDGELVARGFPFPVLCPCTRTRS